LEFRSEPQCHLLLPTVEYSTAEGQTYIFDSINCSTPAAYQVGDTVEVYYPIDAPQEGKMKTNILRLLGTGTAWSFGALGVCLGIGGIAAFALGIFVGRKKEPAAV
jgi:hypothetical protein